VSGRWLVFFFWIFGEKFVFISKTCSFADGYLGMNLLVLSSLGEGEVVDCWVRCRIKSIRETNVAFLHA
jgi:hypothetical protein